MKSRGYPFARCLARTVCATALFTHPFVQAQSEKAVSFNITATDLAVALNQFAQQSNQQIVFKTDATAGKRSPPLRGAYRPQEALDTLLRGSGLVYQVGQDNTIVVTTVGTAGAEKRGGASAPGDKGGQAANPTLLAQAQSAERLGTSQARSGDSDRRAVQLEGIVVTAQKREERLRDVPVPASVIDSESLVNSNQVQLQDYYAKLPGLSLVNAGDGPRLAIRGITTGGNVNQTVGIVVDDIPFGSSAAANVSGNLAYAPELDPSELARIEVLRGPQGTLYGASSMGGLLKYMTVDPLFDRFRARVQGGLASVTNGELGYSVRGAVNVPISGTIALRASGSARRDPGYIDNLQTGQEDVNRTESESGRLAALWRPSDSLSLKVSALYQHTERLGSPNTHLPSPAGPQTISASGRPDLGDLQQNALINTGKYEVKYQVYSATLTANLGRAELTSLTGYSVMDWFTSFDGTYALSAQSQRLFGVSGVAQTASPKNSKFTEEIRLSLPVGDHIEVLTGAFYTKEKSGNHSTTILAVDPATGAIPGVLSKTDVDATYAELAAFANLTFQVTNRFDVQLGSRWGRHKTTWEALLAGALFGPAPIIFPQNTSKDSAFTYLVTPRLRLSPDLMIYSRMASGYRPGGPNLSPAPIPGVPPEFFSDTTQNYELGMKGSALDQTVSFDISLYRIDWKDVQLQIRDPVRTTQTYISNVGGARSSGLEFAFESEPLQGLTLSAAGAYTNAELTEVPPTINLLARPGDRLPYSARWAGTLSANQKFPLWSNATAWVGASVSYVGDRKGAFFSGAAQGDLPSYTQIDIRAGSKVDSWTIDAYVNNVSDERGVLRSGRDADQFFAVAYIRPRTFGLSLTKLF